MVPENRNIWEEGSKAMFQSVYRSHYSARNGGLPGVGRDVRESLNITDVVI